MAKAKKFPDAIAIVFILMIILLIMTWFIPAGEYETTQESGRTVLVPDSYQKLSPEEAEKYDLNITEIFVAPIKGIISAAQIIAFIFIVGGAFSILNKTGAINAGLQKIIERSKENPASKKYVIPVIMILFSLGGATFGMSEEILVFLMITIPLSFALGYDVIVGTAIPFVAATTGFAGAMLNPFTIGVAQGIAEIQPFSGWEYRIIVWAVMTATVITYVMIYANKVEKDKSKSFLHKNFNHREKFKHEKQEFTTSHKLVLIMLVFAFAVIIYGINSFGWYINEISAVFFALGIAAALISRLSLRETVSAFTEGAKDMIPAALVIGFAKGLLIIAQDGKIIDTILYAIASNAKEMPSYISVQVMLLFQAFLNFFIPSGSGQAALTMPILAPLSDVLGISRQTAVLAFQFGDGLSNMIIPTSGVTMGVLAIAKIPYNVWLRWMLPLFIILFIMAILFLIPPVVLFNWG